MRIAFASIGCLAWIALLTSNPQQSNAQELSIFYPSSTLVETTDDYGNTYITTPAEAVTTLPEEFGGPPELEFEGLVIDPAYVYETATDDQGNSYTTTAADESLTAEDVFVPDAITDDNLWQRRTGALPGMQVLESRAPAETEDAPQLRTSVTMAQGGTYNVYLWYGDIGAANADDDATNPTPIQAALEGEELQTFLQADGVLITDYYGFNVLEVALGSVTVADGEEISVIIDDVVGTGARSAYLGLRISEGGLYEPPPPPTYDFNLDDQWLIYPVTGRELILSHGPGSLEDAPAITTDITLAHAGTYEVVFHFMDSEDFPDQGWILASLNGGAVQEYGAGHPDAVRATGGTTPAYPWIDGTTVGGMFWYTAVMGTVEAEAGDTISVTVEDAQDTSGEAYIASVFEGITLRVLEGGPPVNDILVSTAYRYEWGEDSHGNRFNTVGADESLTEDEVFTATRSNSDNLWELRTPNMGPYGFIYSAFKPGGTEDAPMLKTMIEVAEAGTYDVIMYYGDVGQVGTDDEDSPNPIQAGFDPDNLTTYFQADGEFIGLYGFNVLETLLGTVTLEAGEVLEVFIDDADEVEGNDRRSNYGGLLLSRTDTSVQEWSLF